MQFYLVRCVSSTLDDIWNIVAFVISTRCMYQCFWQTNLKCILPHVLKIFIFLFSHHQDYQLVPFLCQQLRPHLLTFVLTSYSNCSIHNVLFLWFIGLLIYHFQIPRFNLKDKNNWYQSRDINMSIIIYQ